MLPKEHSEGEPIGRHEESGGDDKVKMSQRKVMPDTHTLREFSDISCHESAKDKISEANPNLERITTLFQAIEKMFFPNHKCCTLHWVARLCGHG